MTSRERILAALSFQSVDRLPVDLGAMRSTGISAFAYPKLIEALGLPPRRPRVHDTTQMLAIVERDVQEAMGLDVELLDVAGNTALWEDAGEWHDFDYGGRLEARVRHPEAHRVLPGGTVEQKCGEQWNHRMPPGSHVFDALHGGQPVDLDGELPKEDLAALRRRLEGETVDANWLERVVATCRRARESSDRAILLHDVGFPFGFRGGMAAWSMTCVEDPEYVHELHEILTQHAHRRLSAILPHLASYVDVLMVCADDQGTQASTILPPRLYRELYVPYQRRLNDLCHRLAPQVKTFYHCCGAIYEILDDVIASGYDVLNPVQWSAGGHSYREWKDRCRGRIALWGGGVNSQVTLPHGTTADVAAEAAEVASYLQEDSGFVFCPIHNLLAETPAEKVLALYGAAKRVGGGAKVPRMGAAVV